MGLVPSIHACVHAYDSMAAAVRGKVHPELPMDEFEFSNTPVGTCCPDGTKSRADSWQLCSSSGASEKQLPRLRCRNLNAEGVLETVTYQSMVAMAASYARPSAHSSSGLTQGVSQSSSAQQSLVLPFPTEPIETFFDVHDLELQRGESGIIYLCTDRTTGSKLACKTIPRWQLRRGKEVEHARIELEAMCRLRNHEGIVNIAAAFEDQKGLHVVMELCEGGDLFEFIRRRNGLGEREAARIFRQLVVGVQHCHGEGVLHRDIKPENVLLQRSSLGSDSARCESHGYSKTARQERPSVAALDASLDDFIPKLADFGAADFLETPESRACGMHGTTMYAAPEVLLAGTCYGFEADVWSLGMLLAVMLTGSLPSPLLQLDEEQLCSFYEEAVCLDPLSLSLAVAGEGSHELSEEASELVRRMLMVDPRQRATLEEVIAHPWMENAWD